jgi:hypothetical protein
VSDDDNLRADIAKEICVSLERLGAHPELLGIIVSYGDKTLTDEQVLAYLRTFNEKGSMFDQVNTSP